MGMPETTASPPHLYPQTLQLKLYQAFIFSIPILFSIILFLLFYLFYLKRRISNASSPSPPTRPTRSTNHPSPQTPMSEGGLKGVIQKVRLPVIVFGEDPAMKESQCCCCICLGEFEEKEELHQLPPCTHIFHTQCITHWLRSNSSCPMCRSPVVVVTTAANISTNHHLPPMASPPAASIPDITDDDQNATRHPRTNDDQNEVEHGTATDGLLCRSDCGSREEEVVITINLQGSSSSNSL